MTLSRSITSLICDESGCITKEFLATSETAWANEHMTRRYNAAPPSESDGVGSIAHSCYLHLLYEYQAVRRWFTPEGKLSPLLMSQHLATLNDGAIGDGMGWDFLPNGDPEPRMLQFKGTLIACRRVLELRNTEGKRFDCGSLEIGGIVRLVRSAYVARADIHHWSAADTLSGSDLSRRWVAYRTFIFLLRSGADEDWAWDSSHCRKLFGPADNAPGNIR